MPALKSLVRRFLPRRVRKVAARFLAHPPVGSVEFGDLRSTSPISRGWGFDRGTPVDRYYIEAFLGGRSRDFKGRGVEVKSDNYLVRFGPGLDRRDTLLPVQHPGATVVADLSDPEGVPRQEFDLFVCTQTLQFIPALENSIRSCRRMLRPGGVLLATVPGLSRVEVTPEDSGGDYWRFTEPLARLLFEAEFGAENVEVVQYGNVLSAIAFLHGLAAEELSRAELDADDAAFPVILGIRAQVAESSR